MCVVYKYVMNINIIFIAFFSNLPYHKNVVNCTPVRSESCLAVTQLGFYNICQPLIQNYCKYFIRNL